ncbi:7169_t:CDS:2, partial [Dentiscutata heterogama]
FEYVAKPIILSSTGDNDNPFSFEETYEKSGHDRCIIQVPAHSDNDEDNHKKKVSCDSPVGSATNSRVPVTP